MKVRIIAGPNGSGKSTISDMLMHNQQFRFHFGYYINADNIEHSLKTTGNYQLADGFESINENSFIDFIINHELNKKHKLINNSFDLQLKNKRIYCSQSIVNSYLSAIIAEYLRFICLEKKISFSFETVFSDQSKIEFVKKIAKAKGKIYLYIISTLNPSINIARVEQRVKCNGHAVSKEKIISRYYKSLTNLIKTIPYTYKCFIIDNSEEYNPILIAEIGGGKQLTFINKEYQPSWTLKLLKPYVKKRNNQ